MWNFRLRLLRYLNKLKSYLCAFRFGTGVLSVFTHFFLRHISLLYYHYYKIHFFVYELCCYYTLNVANLTYRVVLRVFFPVLYLIKLSRAFCWLSRPYIFISYILFEKSTLTGFLLECVNDYSILQLDDLKKQFRNRRAREN